MELNTQYVSNNNTKTGAMVPKWIVIHNTDNFNAGANALAHAKAQFNGNFSNMSCHWYVDDSDTAYQATPHNKGAWHVGVNYGGRLFGQASNNNTVGIEMCVQKGYDYEKTFQNAVELCKHLMSVLGIDADHVVQHWDVCGKNCPSQIRGNSDWDRFRSLIRNGGGSAVPDPAPTPAPTEYKLGMYKVNVDSLNIRSGPGTSNGVVGKIEDKGSYTIVEMKNGSWGRLKSGTGWINCSSKYCSYSGNSAQGKASSYPYIGKCTGNGVRVRKGAGTNFGTIAGWPSLNKGNLVDVLGKDGDWFHVNIQGNKGYVSTKYIKTA